MMTERQIVEAFITKCNKARELALAHPSCKLLRHKWEKWIIARECLAKVLTENAPK